MHGRERPSWPQGGMFSEATHDIARQRQPQHQPPYPATQALAHPSFNSTRNRSLESFPTMSISYPESSQRTRMRDVQFSPSDEGFMPAQNAPHPNNRDVLLSGAEFSPAPIPSDRPPPPPRPPTRSFSNRYFVPPQQSPTSNGPARSPPSFNQPLNSYRELTSSLSDATDDNLTQASHHHHPSNFIPMCVPPEIQHIPNQLSALEYQNLQPTSAPRRRLPSMLLKNARFAHRARNPTRPCLLLQLRRSGCRALPAPGSRAQ
ncbi:hypothetical protein B0H17DRAFT_419499 [Mycena rosella]|uniref:Uncharacterized protein n=1 Tax=Mycena rosella TaxID=1033263 RepID=A0AAD7CJR1_MYCRO|nr:hypothetical protein B0H17DRAFT_419499 [Mycena rosella]